MHVSCESKLKTELDVSIFVLGLRIQDPLSGLTAVEDTMLPQTSRQHELTVAPMPVLPTFTLMNASTVTPPISMLPPTKGIQPQPIQAVPVLPSSPEKVN